MPFNALSLRIAAAGEDLADSIENRWPVGKIFFFRALLQGRQDLPDTGYVLGCPARVGARQAGDDTRTGISVVLGDAGDQLLPAISPAWLVTMPA